MPKPSTQSVTLRTQLWLLTGLVLVGIITWDVLTSRRNIDQMINSQVEGEADTIHGILMATRRVYHGQFLASGLPVEDHTIGFLPAHALARISQEFPGWTRRGVSFNNVSDRPRNPRNRADAHELLAIDYFRNTPLATKRVASLADESGEETIHWSYPIRVEKYCLKCHGRREDAPETVARKYAEGYGYEEGELRGILSIRIPTAPVRESTTRAWSMRFGGRIAGYVLLLASMGLFLEHRVARRLGRVTRAAERVAKGHFDEPLHAGTGDEIGNLTRTMNAMTEALSQRDRALSESREQLRMATEQMYDALLLVDLMTEVVVLWNDAAERLFGYARTELVGRPIELGLFSADSVAWFRNVLTRFRDTKRSSAGGNTVLLTMMHRDGYPVAIEASVSAAHTGEYCFVIVVMRDVRARKEREHRRALVREGIEVENTVAQCFLQVGTPFEERMARALTLCGSMGGTLGPTSARLYLRSEDGDDSLASYGEQADDCPRAPGPAGAVLVVDTCPSTHERNPHGHYVVPVCTGGEELGCLVLDTMPSPSAEPERLSALAGVGSAFARAVLGERAARRLRAAAEASDSANRAKSKFLAMVSHEIRTPIGGMLGIAELLAADRMTAEERVKYAGLVVRSGRTLLSLLNDLLDLSKVEAGKLEILPTPTDVRTLLRDTDDLFRCLALEKGLRVETNWKGDEDSTYLLDGTRVRQMLSNLVSNAIKFTRMGGIVLEGGPVTESPGSEMLEFSVRDTGPGLSAEQCAALFRPYAQVGTTSAERARGTGLGLHLVRSLTELMGGTVGVMSTPGQGSRFWIRLPLRRPERRMHSAHTGNMVPSRHASGRPARILLVEDAVINRLVVEQMLGAKGFEVRSMADGRSAVEELTDAARERPDIVLMDCNMPEMDGLDATRAIREHEQQHGLPRIPILALTAGTFAEDRQSCQAAGMDDFLGKPVVLDELLEVIAKWMAVVRTPSD